MTPAEWTALSAVLFSLLLGVSVFAVNHVIGGLKEEIQKLSHDRDQAIKDIAVLQERSRASEIDRLGLREWKHRVIDPYIPACVDDHERRLVRVETHLNGHLK